MVYLYNENYNSESTSDFVVLLFYVMYFLEDLNFIFCPSDSRKGKKRLIGVFLLRSLPYKNDIYNSLFWQ